MPPDLAPVTVRAISPVLGSSSSTLVTGPPDEASWSRTPAGTTCADPLSAKPLDQSSAPVRASNPMVVVVEAAVLMITTTTSSTICRSISEPSGNGTSHRCTPERRSRPVRPRFHPVATTTVSAAPTTRNASGTSSVVLHCCCTEDGRRGSSADDRSDRSVSRPTTATVTAISATVAITATTAALGRNRDGRSCSDRSSRSSRSTSTGVRSALVKVASSATRRRSRSARPATGRACPSAACPPRCGR